MIVTAVIATMSLSILTSLLGINSYQNYSDPKAPNFVYKFAVFLCIMSFMYSCSHLFMGALINHAGASTNPAHLMLFLMGGGEHMISEATYYAFKGSLAYLVIAVIMLAIDRFACPHIYVVPLALFIACILPAGCAGMLHAEYKSLDRQYYYRESCTEREGPSYLCIWILFLNKGFSARDDDDRKKLGGLLIDRFRVYVAAHFVPASSRYSPLKFLQHNCLLNCFSDTACYTIRRGASCFHIWVCANMRIALMVLAMFEDLFHVLMGPLALLACGEFGLYVINTVSRLFSDTDQVVHDANASKYQLIPHPHITFWLVVWKLMVYTAQCVAVGFAIWYLFKASTCS